MTDQAYMNCDFILGSVAEVERLFSFYKYFLTQNRRSSTPQLFEAIVFLKLNERFWNSHIVRDDVNFARYKVAEALFNAHEVH